MMATVFRHQYLELFYSGYIIFFRFHFFTFPKKTSVLQICK